MKTGNTGVYPIGIGTDDFKWYSVPTGTNHNFYSGGNNVLSINNLGEVSISNNMTITSSSSSVGYYVINISATGPETPQVSGITINNNISRGGNIIVGGSTNTYSKLINNMYLNSFYSLIFDTIANNITT